MNNTPTDQPSQAGPQQPSTPASQVNQTGGTLSVRIIGNPSSQQHAPSGTGKRAASETNSTLDGDDVPPPKIRKVISIPAQFDLANTSSSKLVVLTPRVSRELFPTPDQPQKAAPTTPNVVSSISKEPQTAATSAEANLPLPSVETTPPANIDRGSYLVEHKIEDLDENGKINGQYAVFFQKTLDDGTVALVPGTILPLPGETIDTTWEPEWLKKTEESTKAPDVTSDNANADAPEESTEPSQPVSSTSSTQCPRPSTPQPLHDENSAMSSNSHEGAGSESAWSDEDGNCTEQIIEEISFENYVGASRSKQRHGSADDPIEIVDDDSDDGSNALSMRVVSRQKDRNGRDVQVLTESLKCPEEHCSEYFLLKGEGVPMLNVHERILDHVEKIHGITAPNRCYACNGHPAIRNMTHHLETVHANQSSWRCGKCTSVSATYHNLKKHQALFHAEGKFCCANCSYSSATRIDVYRHTYHQHKKFECNVADCNVSFNYLSQLKRHQALHMGICPYKCKWPNCQFGSDRKSYVVAHVKQKHFPGVHNANALSYVHTTNPDADTPELAKKCANDPTSSASQPKSPNIAAIVTTTECANATSTTSQSKQVSSGTLTLPAAKAATDSTVNDSAPVRTNGAIANGTASLTAPKVGATTHPTTHWLTIG